MRFMKKSRWPYQSESVDFIFEGKGMALISSDQQNKLNLTIESFHNPQSQAIIPFLRQRVSEGPSSRILYYLDGSTLLNLRSVSKMTPEDDKIIRDLIGSRVRFVVDGSEECNAGMIPSYLRFGWSSLVFPKTLDRDDTYLALQSAHLLLTEHEVHIQDLTIAPGLVPMGRAGRIIEPLFKRLDSLQVISSEPDLNSLSVMLSYCESVRKLDLHGYTGINLMILGLGQLDKLEKVFQKVEALNVSETGITRPVLRQLLMACAPLKSLNLHECTHISAAINEMTEEQVQKVFGQVEDLDLGETLITPEALLKIAGSKPPLRALSLYDCKNVSGFYGQEDIFKMMRSLNLGRTDIEWRSLLNILASCQNLEQLFLGGCLAISKAIEAFTPEDNLPQVVHRLEVLVLQETNISEKALSSLLLPCRSLQYLDLTSCRAFPAVLTQMTDEEIQLVFQGVLKLTLSSVPDVPLKDFERLLAQIRSLQILNLEVAGWITAFIEWVDEKTLERLFVDLKGISFLESDLSKEVAHKLLRVFTALKASRMMFLLESFLREAFDEKA